MRALVGAMRDCSGPLVVVVTGLAPFSVSHAQSAPPAASTQVAQASPPATSTETAGAKPGDTNTQLSDIVVTATRRSELLSKVPISISAYSQEALDMKGVKDFTDVARFTPGVTVDANGTNNISIRGISSSAGAGTTGIYIDDTPIQMRALSYYSDDALPASFDLDRIEVLRGPQGTLFGAGAEGGAVRYIMAEPNMEKPSTYARSEFSFTQGGAPSYEAGVAYGAPIEEDVLGFRASLWYRHDGGWIDRVDPAAPHQTIDQNSNYDDDIEMRLAVKWNANDRVTITPSFLFEQRNQNDNTAYWPIFSNPSSNSYKNADPSQLAEPDHYILPALKVQADLGPVSLFSNTSYFERYDQAGYDGTLYNLSYFQTFGGAGYAPLLPGTYPLLDGTGVHLPAAVANYRAPASATNELHSWTQEFRLESNDDKSPLMWTTGLFLSVNKQTSIEQINDPDLNALFESVFATNYINVFGVPLMPNNDSYYGYNYSEDKQIAVFGEATYSFTDKLKATLGVRFSRTDVSFASYANGPQNFGQTGGSGDEHQNPVTPKFSLQYQADPNDLYYATYAKGFRIGGANAPIPPQACPTDLANLGLTAAPDSYKSDTVNSYEIGSKNLIANQLQLASSIYYIQWNSIQQNIYLPICGFQFTSNFGNAVAKGADMQLNYAATKQLTFDVAIGYTDAKYTTNVGSAANPIAFAGDAIEGASVTPAPPWTVALGGQYDFGWNGRKSFVRLDYQYQGHSNVPTASEDPRATGTYDSLAFTPKAYSFVSVRAGTTVDRWSISTFIDNLFNAHPEFPPSAYPHTEVDPYNATPPSAVIRAYTLRPRTIGVTATTRF
jgi:outer membrane receptor protein involved in Fe transport